jgi:hypothetical protein
MTTLSVLQLPDDALMLDSLDVLALWLRREMTGTPEWIKDAVKALEPIERRALLRPTEAPQWACESARWRLRIAAAKNDGEVLTGTHRDELALFDATMRAVAQKCEEDVVRIQIGKIRKAIFQHLSERVNRRERVEYRAS